MRNLVIGGTLFIGRALVEQLLARGEEVVILHRSHGTPFGNRVREIRCDRNDVSAVRRALQGQSFDVVYDNVYDWERGTTGAQVEASARAAWAGGALGRYVFTSSVGAYAGGSDLDESAPLASPSDPNDYARNKAESERALLRLYREDRVPIATLRPAFVYGPSNPFDREAFFWDRIVADRPVIIPGAGDREMQWVHASDVARAAILAAECDEAVGSAYNLGNDPPLTQVQFVQTLARAAGKSVRLVHIPRERLAAAGGGLMAPPFYFGVYLDVPPMTMRMGRAKAELGLELTPLEEGLAETFAWYQQQERPQPDFSWEERLIAEAGGS